MGAREAQGAMGGSRELRRASLDSFQVHPHAGRKILGIEGPKGRPTPPVGLG